MTYPVLLTVVSYLALVFSQPVSDSSANARCNLTLAQAPEIRGIRLGMNAQQLLELFPEVINHNNIAQAVKESKQVDRHGFSNFNLRPDRQTANARLAGVDYISVEIIDERVTSIHIAYVGPEWKTVDQFASKLSEAFHLPNASWESQDASQRLLKCDGFLVSVLGRGGSRYSWVQVRDTSAYQVLEDRREAAKEKERQAFRP